MKDIRSPFGNSNTAKATGSHNDIIYVIFTAIIAIPAFINVAADLFLIQLSKEVANDTSGTELYALAIVPAVLLGIVMLSVSLLSIGPWRRNIPRWVRYWRGALIAIGIIAGFVYFNG